MFSKVKILASAVGKTAVKAFGAGKLFCIKNGPTIAIVGGLVAGGAAIVTACVATTKLTKIVEETKEEAEAVRTAEEAGELENPGKEKAKYIAKAAGKVALAYAPAVIFSATSVTLILTGHNAVLRRCTALTAAYAGLTESYEAYRSRVRERLGEDEEEALYLGKKTELIETESTDEQGNLVKTIKESASVIAPEVYDRFFDETCDEWSKIPGRNISFLRSLENTANRILQTRGWVFLSEIYDMIGYPRTDISNLIGWSIAQNPDSHVDLGVFDPEDPKKRAFVNGYERSILLHFNVDRIPIITDGKTFDTVMR